MRDWDGLEMEQSYCYLLLPLPEGACLFTALFVVDCRRKRKPLERSLSSHVFFSFFGFFFYFLYAPTGCKRLDDGLLQRPWIPRQGSNPETGRKRQGDGR